MNKREVQNIALEFLSQCKQHNFVPVIHSPTCVGVTRKFSPGDKEAFCACDMMAGGVLDVIPQKGNSQWGTDGGSIGGAIALQNGKFELNASGCSKKVVAFLRMFV